MRLGNKTDSKRDTEENGWKHSQTVNWAGNETALVKKFVEKKKLEMQRILFFIFFLDEISPSLGKTCNLRNNKLLDKNGSMDTVY